MTEKLQAKDAVATEPPAVITGQKAEPLAVPVAADHEVVSSGLQLSVKVEDRLSTGSAGSAVVDEDAPQQLVDSGDSYFLSDEYPRSCVVGPVVNGVQSEEDDVGSDDGGQRNYFSNVFTAVTTEDEPLGWWVWS